MLTVADMVEDTWNAARATVGARKRFCEGLRAITTRVVFPARADLVETLRTGQPHPSSATDNPLPAIPPIKDCQCSKAQNENY
jgi:hypothetical protein